MQGSINSAPRPAGRSPIMIGLVLAICAVSASSIYAFLKADEARESLTGVNQFYLPVLKQLNLLNGKWSAYQRSFEQAIGFRRWGVVDHEASRLRLGKMIEANLSDLARVSENAAALNVSRSRLQILDFIARLQKLSNDEPSTVAAIESLVRAKNYGEAASAYTQARQEHLSISQSLSALVRDIENQLTLSQVATERELRNSLILVLALLGASLALSIVVLVRLRRWIGPILAWTKVAQEIALKGSHEGIRFPQTQRHYSPEVELLTREFTRMAMTVLERERTIHQQNDRLKEQNVTLRKLAEAEEKLNHARKLVLAGNLSSQVAHEVRNPLNSMSLHLDLLDEELGLIPDQKERDAARARLQAIVEQVGRLERITRKYLDVSQPLLNSRSPLDLHVLIEKCLAFLKSEIQASGIQVLLELNAGNPSVAGDGDSLSQVIFNLIRNSIDALKDLDGAKMLKIVTQDALGSICVRVEDSGPGVPVEVKCRIFEPFVTSKPSGNGLGLSVSRQICLEHGGELKFIDSARSTQFEFSIPTLKPPVGESTCSAS